MSPPEDDNLEEQNVGMDDIADTGDAINDAQANAVTVIGGPGGGNDDPYQYG